MAKKTRIILNKEALRKDLLEVLSFEQTQLLVNYAIEKVSEIGERIQTYHSANHMDRTGNLLNSLCWGVSFQGSLKAGGFYRDAITRANGIAKTSTSYLHEWFGGEEKYLIPVNGRELAESYLQSYGNNGAKGWRVFFAILAPYWGYWEEGFTMRTGGGNSGVPRTERFMQFAVMTQFFDEVKADLKPARVRFRVSVAKYNHAKLKEKWEKRANSSYRFGDR